MFLIVYEEATVLLWWSEHLFFCYDGPKKRETRLPQWWLDVLIYDVTGCTVLGEFKCRWKGVPLEDIYVH